MINPNKMASVAEMLDKETEGVWPVEDLFRFVFVVRGFFFYLRYLFAFFLSSCLQSWG